MTAGSEMLKLLRTRRKQYSLPQPFYTDDCSTSRT